MCLPVGILRCLIQIEPYIVLLGGIAAFLFTMITQIHYSLMLQANAGESWMIFGQGFLTAFWIFSSYVIFNGICGIVGEKQKIRCCLIIFNIGNFIIFLAFLILMIVGFVGVNITQEQGVQHCKENDLTSSELRTLTNDSQSLLCSAECPCFYNLSVPLPHKLRFSSDSDTTKPYKVQNCTLFETTQNTTVKFYANYLGQIQQETGCTGWCEPFYTKVFYNINSPVQNTEKYCQQVIMNKLTEMCQVMGDVGAAITALMLVLITFTFCICCHPEKKEEKDYYKRLMTG